MEDLWNEKYPDVPKISCITETFNQSVMILQIILQFKPKNVFFLHVTATRSSSPETTLL